MLGVSVPEEFRNYYVEKLISHDEYFINCNSKNDCEAYPNNNFCMGCYEEYIKDHYSNIENFKDMGWKIIEGVIDE